MHPSPGLKLNLTIAECNICKNGSPPKGLGVGETHARIVLVAQNPGNPTKRNPDLVPFDYHLWFGKGEREWRSGGMLTKMLRDVGIALHDLYITNTFKCQGKVNEQWIYNCSDWLEGELLHLRDLKLIVAMGGVAGSRLGIRDSNTLEIYTSRLKPERRWWLTYVAHPAAPLYPNGISENEYRHQWEFVAAVVRKMSQ